MMTVLAIAPWIGFGNLPIFPMFGIWYQSEPLVLVLFGLGFISAVALILLSVSQPKLARYVIGHPIVVVPFLIGCISLVHFVFADNRLSSLLGNAQTGLGGAWFLTLAAISAVARCVFRVIGKRLKFIIISYLIVSSICISLVSIAGVQNWKMFNFDDHLAFFAFFLWVLPFLIVRNWLVAFGIAFISSAIIVFSSSNVTAEIAFVAMAVGTFLYWLVASRMPETFPLRSLAASVGPALALSMAVFVQYFNDLGLFASLGRRLAGTMHSRHLLSNVIIEPLENTHTAIVTGMGWGQFSDLLMTNIPIDKTTLYNYRNNAYNESTWMWDSLRRVDFHSHNLFVETFGALGIIGMLLLFVYLFCLVKYSKKGVAAAAFGGVTGLVLLNSLWFQMPSSVGVMAVAFGAVSGGVPSKTLTLHFGARLRLLCLSVVSLSLLYALVNVFVLGTQGVKGVEVNLGVQDASTQHCENIIADNGRNGFHFAELLKNFSSRIDTKLKDSPETLEDKDWQRLSSLLCQADTRLEEDKALLPGVRALMVRSDYLIKYPQQISTHPKLQEQMYSGWENNVIRVLALAPERGDLAVAYMNWLYQNRGFEKLEQVAQVIAQEDKTVSLGNWFMGLVLLEKNGQQEQAVKLLTSALNGNIERFFPVDPNLKQQLLAINGG